MSFARTLCILNVNQTCQNIYIFWTVRFKRFDGQIQNLEVCAWIMGETNIRCMDHGRKHKFSIDSVYGVGRKTCVRGSYKNWFGHAPTPIWFSGFLGRAPEHMLVGLAHGQMLVGQAHEHMLMGHAHEHMLMGRAHQHMLSGPSQEAGKPNWRWRVTKPVPVRSANIGFPPIPN